MSAATAPTRLRLDFQELFTLTAYMVCNPFFVGSPSQRI